MFFARLILNAAVEISEGIYGVNLVSIQIETYQSFADALNAAFGNL